ncbi:glutaredoxin family protein [Candidatus Woesearchaeota archaeon]|nr:glutaredoxin family protein [Candidatus Woesearchaeota archaeon]
MPKQTVKVYSTPTCVYCQKAKAFLKENKIDYEEINVAEDEEAREAMIEKTGQMGVPVIEIGDTIIVGFDKEAMKKALNLK